MYYKCVYKIKGLDLKENLIDVIESDSFDSAYKFLSLKYNSNYYDIFSISIIDGDSDLNFLFNLNCNSIYVDYLSNLKVGDYIEGTEEFGKGTTITRGWINDIHVNNDSYVFIVQADDYWKGARGTTLFSHLGPIIKVDVDSSKRHNLNRNLKFITGE